MTLAQSDGAGVVRYYNVLVEGPSFLDDVLAGLAAPRKAIPPKYFYDWRGSKLFEAICELPEYYPTRTERSILLDRADPSRVIGRLREPLIKPEADEREGYVPNVVYTCGGMIHRGKLILPYAVSDSATCFAVVALEELIATLD